MKLNQHCVAFTQVAAWRAPQACGWHSGWWPSRPLRSLPVVALSSLSRTRYNPAGALALTLQPGIAGKSGCQRERRPSLRCFKAARAGSQTAPSKGSDPQYIDLKIGRSGIPPTCPHVTKGRSLTKAMLVPVPRRHPSPLLTPPLAAHRPLPITPCTSYAQATSSSPPSPYPTPTPTIYTPDPYWGPCTPPPLRALTEVVLIVLHALVLLRQLLGRHHVLCCH